MTDSKKRGTGMVTITFESGKGEFSNRIPQRVVGFKVIEKASGKEVSFALSELSEEMIMGLAARGAKNTIESHCRNKNDESGSNVIENAVQMYSQLKAGNLYARGEGKTVDKGPKFDFEFYMAVARHWTKKTTKNDMTPMQESTYMTKLQSMTTAERREAVKRWRTDPVYAMSYTQVKAQHDVKKLAGKTSEVELDLFA